MRRLRATVPNARLDLAGPISRTFCAGVACAVFLLVSGCSRQNPTSAAIVVDAEFAPEAARAGPGAVTVKLRDAAATPLSGARVTVEANMSHPGMAPIFREAKEVAPGRYQADLELGMRGDWVILLHIRLANGKQLERQLAVEAK